MDTRAGHKPTTQTAVTDEIDLKRLAVALFHRWAFIAQCAGVGILLAILLITQVTPTYRASTKILIDTRQQRVLTSEDVLPGLAVDASVIESQVELLTSTRIAERVLMALEQEQAPPVSPHEGTHNSKELQRFLSGLSVSRIGLSYLIDVSYTSDNPDLSAKIANQIVRNYLAEEIAARMGLTERANTWLKERIKQLAPEVRELEEQSHDYRAKNRLVVVGDQNIAERTVIDYVQQLNLARAALAEAEARLALDRERSAASLQSQNNYETARTKVALMERGIEVLMNDLITRKALAIKLGELEREETAAKGLFESLLKRQKETEVQQNLQTVNARVVEEALAPARPSWPRKSVLLAVFAGAGGLLGMMIVLIQTIIRDGAYSRQDVERYVGLACDFAIPLLPRAARSRRARSAAGAPDFSGARIYAVTHPQTRVSRQFRSIAQKITQDRQRPCSTIAVISPDNGDGKTLIASNLAFTLSAIGNRVLLLDLTPGATATEPKQSVPANDEPGGPPAGSSPISEVQSGGTKIGYHRWPIDQASNALLIEAEILKFLSGVREHYNQVVLDTESLNENTDMIGIVKRCDTALVVISRARTALRDIRSMIALWGLAERNELLLVMNRAQ